MADSIVFQQKRPDAYVAELARMKEEVMRAQREREHWHRQYEALRQENLDLWTELEMARRIIRDGK